MCYKLMDVLEKRKLYEKNLIKIFSLLKFDKQPIKIKGSYSYANIKYPSDYDLYSNLFNKKYTAKEAYEHMSLILKNILSEPNIYFLELKEQAINNEKIKWAYGDNFKYDDFKTIYPNIDYLKLDLVYYINFKFVEVSINYYFNKYENKEEETKDLLDNIKELEKGGKYYKLLKKLDLLITLKFNKKETKEILDNIKELEKEGDYYKVLKRLVLLFKQKNNKAKIVELFNFFNSSPDYQLLNNLIATKKIIDLKLNEPLTNKKIKLYLSSVKIPINKLDEYIQKLSNKLNKEAKLIYETISK